MTVEEVLIMERCLLNEARYEYLIWASETVAEEKNHKSTRHGTAGEEGKKIGREMV